MISEARTIHFSQGLATDLPLTARAVDDAENLVQLSGEIVPRPGVNAAYELPAATGSDGQLVFIAESGKPTLAAIQRKSDERILSMGIHVEHWGVTASSSPVVPPDPDPAFTTWLIPHVFGETPISGAMQIDAGLTYGAGRLCFAILSLYDDKYAWWYLLIDHIQTWFSNYPYFAWSGDDLYGGFFSLAEGAATIHEKTHPPVSLVIEKWTPASLFPGWRGGGAASGCSPSKTSIIATPYADVDVKPVSGVVALVDSSGMFMSVLALVSSNTVTGISAIVYNTKTGELVHIMENTSPMDAFEGELTWHGLAFNGDMVLSRSSATLDVLYIMDPKDGILTSISSPTDRDAAAKVSCVSLSDNSILWTNGDGIVWRAVNGTSAEWKEFELLPGERLWLQSGMGHVGGKVYAAVVLATGPNPYWEIAEIDTASTGLSECATFNEAISAPGNAMYRLSDSLASVVTPSGVGGLDLSAWTRTEPTEELFGGADSFSYVWSVSAGTTVPRNVIERLGSRWTSD